MGSKFFGNRMEKQTPGKKGAKQKFANKNPETVLLQYTFLQSKNIV